MIYITVFLELQYRSRFRTSPGAKKKERKREFVIEVKAKAIYILL